MTTKRWTPEQREAARDRITTHNPSPQGVAAIRKRNRTFTHEALHEALAKFIPRLDDLLDIEST